MTEVYAVYENHTHDYTRAARTFDGIGEDKTRFGIACRCVQDNLPTGGLGWVVERKRPDKRPMVYRIEWGKRRASPEPIDSQAYRDAIGATPIEQPHA